MKRHLLLAAALVLATSPSEAKHAGGANRWPNYYVSPGGSDSNLGTLASPWATFTHADGAVTPGATVHVLAGTYAGSISTTSGGYDGAGVTWVCEPRWSCKIVPPANSPIESAWDVRGPFVTIDGFEIDGTNYISGTVWTQGIDLHSDHGIAQNNKIHDIMTNAAQQATNGSHGGSLIVTDGFNNNEMFHVVRNNVLYNLGTSDHTLAGASFLQALYDAAGHSTITNNLIFNGSGACIESFHDSDAAVIANNTMFNCQWGIDAEPGGAFHLLTTPDNFKFVNNLIYNVNKYCIILITGTNNLVSNNLVNTCNTFTGFGTYSFSAGNAAANEILGAPVFVNNTGDVNGDYHEQASSPSVDAGTATAAPNVSLDYVKRPQGAGYDVGAYER